MKKENLQIARRFANTFRFIDDLLTVNDDNFFAKNYKDIYPPELQLNLESTGDEVSFLDLHLSKVDRQVDIKLFDKRDNFPFSIVRLPFFLVVIYQLLCFMPLLEQKLQELEEFVPM